jgi:hypothetical protein
VKTIPCIGEVSIRDNVEVQRPIEG